MDLRSTGLACGDGAQAIQNARLFKIGDGSVRAEDHHYGLAMNLSYL